MVVHSPGYQNKVFAVYADSVKLGNEIPKDMQPVIRGKMKDYPKLRLKDLLPFPGGTDIDSGVEDMGSLNEYGKFQTDQGAREAYKLGRFFAMHDVEDKIGKTTQEHIDQDDDIIVLGLKEYDELV
jgi:hypothetical protein